MVSEVEDEFDIVIHSNSNPFNFQLKEVWNYRDLLFLFVKRDFISFYKQTILGPLWFFIQPLFTTIIYTFVFGNLAGISSDGIPKPLFYLSGVISWNYFSECLLKTSTVFKDNANIFGKVYFPRLIMPLSIIASNLIRFFVQCILFFIIYIYYDFNGHQFSHSWYIFMLPFLIILMAFLGLGMGLIITSLTTKYRDLAYLITFGVQLMMYTTTVVFPLSSASLKYKKFLLLNPMTGIIESLRYLIFGIGESNIFIIGYSILFTFLVLIFGILIFNKTEKSFVDTV